MSDVHVRAHTRRSRLHPVESAAFRLRMAIDDAERRGRLLAKVRQAKDAGNVVEAEAARAQVAEHDSLPSPLYLASETWLWASTLRLASRIADAVVAGGGEDCIAALRSEFFEAERSLGPGVGG